MTDNDAGRDTIARLTEEVLPTLIERLTQSQLGEIEVREDGWRIRLRRPAAGNGQAAVGQPLHGATVTRQPQSSAAGQPGTGDGRAPRDVARGQVTSPAVGYFVARDGLALGTTLRNGDLIGHVDVLGVRQEVVSPIDGVLRSLEVEAGEAVEYGQPIGRVEPGVQ